MKKPANFSTAVKSVISRVVTRVPLVVLLLCALAVTAFAYYTFAATAFVSPVRSGSYTIEIGEAASGAAVEGEYVCPETADGLHTFTLTASGTAADGHCKITVGEDTYTTAQIASGSAITLTIQAEQGTLIRFEPSWGESGGQYGDGDVIAPAPINPFAGLTISVMGDSISTYTGWSDAYPITDESCRFRYGEAYYGPVGGDFHNTDMVVEDTWWHQAAAELGAEILRVNSGNSTGLFYASYPANADWDQYLKEMLVYKSRPYYMGMGEEKPDIIALYIGSNEVARGTVSEMGSIDDVDLDALIVANEDGSFTYAEPTTVAESYCILLHKISVTYPDAEVYCFAVLPNAGGYLSTVNKRLTTVYPFNEMVRGVAAHYGAHVVELLDYFQLDPDGDGVAVQEDFERFQTYFHNDPHPNATGFDVITECFVSEVLEHSKYAD